MLEGGFGYQHTTQSPFGGVAARYTEQDRRRNSRDIRWTAKDNDRFCIYLSLDDGVRIDTSGTGSDGGGGAGERQLIAVYVKFE